MVLYEMITGRQLFTGTNTTDVLAAVVRQEIDWRRLPGTLPTAVGHLLRRCLERDPRERLRDIGEARVLLQQQTRADDGPAARPSGPRAARIIWPMAAGVLAIALAVLASTLLREREAPPIEPLRFTIPALAAMPVPRPTLAPVLAWPLTAAIRRLQPRAPSGCGPTKAAKRTGWTTQRAAPRPSSRRTAVRSRSSLPASYARWR